MVTNYLHVYTVYSVTEYYGAVFRPIWFHQPHIHMCYEMNCMVPNLKINACFKGLYICVTIIPCSEEVFVMLILIINVLGPDV